MKLQRQIHSSQACGGLGGYLRAGRAGLAGHSVATISVIRWNSGQGNVLVRNLLEEREERSRRGT